MLELDAHFFKTWRESWRTHPDGRRKEERIRQLEDLVKNNILKDGLKSHKEVLAEVVKWKYGKRGQGMAVAQRENFMRNDEDKVREVTQEVLDSLKADPGKVFDCIGLLIDKLVGAGIPVASAFLRFLDPVNHRYGVIDRNVAEFLNVRGFTDFEFSKKGFIRRNSNRNLWEYQKYHDWLQKKAKELEGVTHTDIDGKQQPFRAVDIERAIFLSIQESKKQ